MKSMDACCISRDEEISYHLFIALYFTKTLKLSYKTTQLVLTNIDTHVDELITTNITDNIT